ncbi:MAG: ATP-binding cassette domain-containing protein [Thermoplasmata archaeon]
MLLSIDHLRFELGKFRISVEKLEFPGGRNFLMGPNGSGKTTLMKLICGIFNPSEGSIEMNGESLVHKPPWERKISYIPQDLLLFPNMNVEKNLRFSINHGGGNDEIYRQLISELDLKELLDRKTTELSGGQAQRVAVARAIISDPDLVLMDEPLSMQDQVSRLSILSKLKDLMEDYSFSIIYVTHDQTDLDFGFDSLTFMNGGRVVESVKSVMEISHVSSRSMLRFGNTIVFNGDYYEVTDGSIYFSNSEGYVFRHWENPEYHVYLVRIDQHDYFLRLRKPPDGNLINFEFGKMKRMEP